MHSATNVAPGEDADTNVHFRYTTVKGYFLQSEFDADIERFSEPVTESKVDFMKQNFGLISRTYETDHDNEVIEKDQWRRFERYVRYLNQNSKEGVRYKVLFLGRHGQGWHNVAEAKYGTKAWDSYWSKLDGAEGITWADAELTKVGQGQALYVHRLWASLLPKGLPSPETYYVSPLTRAIETANLSFKGLDLPKDKAYRPIVKELLREAIGVHTCDRRRSASYIHERFPHASLEPGFSEDDPLWTSDYREPRLARRHRVAQLLDDVFSHDDGVFLSFTSHSGAISSILEAIGHRPFDLETGGVIPVFIKAEKVAGKRPQPPNEPSADPPACTSPSEAHSN